MESEKLLRKMVQSTGGNLKITSQKAIAMIFFLMEQPTMVKYKIKKGMVMEF